MSANWRKIKCWGCGGHGIYWNGDICDCRDCDGAGQLWIVPSGHVFSYPGGPAKGQTTSKEWENGISVYYMSKDETIDSLYLSIEHYQDEIDAYHKLLNEIFPGWKNYCIVPKTPC